MYGLIDKIIKQRIKRVWECRVEYWKISESLSLKDELNILAVRKKTGYMKARIMPTHLCHLVKVFVL